MGDVLQRWRYGYWRYMMEFRSVVIGMVEFQLSTPELVASNDSLEGW